MTSDATPVKPPSAWRLWENPVFLRYCRSRLRKRGLVPSLIIFVVFSAFAYLITPMAFRRFDEGRMQLKEFMEKEAAKNPSAKKTLDRFLAIHASESTLGPGVSADGHHSAAGHPGAYSFCDRHRPGGGRHDHGAG
jgi:hypothetical protein